MKKIVCIMIAFMALASYAQKADGIIKGKLVDTASIKPVADATVSIFQASDSLLVNFTLSDKLGSFEIKGLGMGAYRLVISHQVYGELKKEAFLTSQQRQVDLGEIILNRDVKTLGEVVISSETPIIVKNDTIQFNASAFKTRPNSVAEDILKRIPGIEVDKTGNVKAQGEQVQKIYVDGKEFFANDPQLATKNITAEMIESVQVFDDMSEQAKFTKIDDGSRSKAINIKLKKNRNKGIFSRMMAGYGDRQRFETNIGFNKFNNTQRVSVVFNTNNINKQGFSFSDVGQDNSGGSQGRSSRAGNNGGSGLTRSLSTGINYSDQWGSRVRVTGSYFYTKINAEQQQEIFRRSTFDDSVAMLTRTNGALSRNENHRFNLRVEYDIDSANSILYTPSITFQKSNSGSEDTSFSYSQIPGAKYLAITGKTRNNSQRDGMNWNNNLLFRHRFRKTGRTLTVGWNNTFGDNRSDGLVFSRNVFYNEDGSLLRRMEQDQQNKQRSNNHNNVISASYTEPVGRNKIIEMNYAYTNNQSISDRQTFDYNPATKEYDQLNTQLTNNFRNTFLAHRFGTNFRLQEKKYNFQLGLNVQQSVQETRSYFASRGKDSLSHVPYTNFFPMASFNFTPARSRNIRLNYNGRTNQPSVMQLQDVLDYTDPLNVKTGNPRLRQEFNHNLNLGYNTFNSSNFRFVAINMGFSTTGNKIVNSIDSLTTGVQLHRPENINGTYRLFSFFTLGLPFKNPDLKGSSINFTNNLNYNRDISLLYRKRNIGQTLNITHGAAITFVKQKYDFSIRANISYTRVNYSVNAALNEDYFTQIYSGDFSYVFPGDIILAGDFDYYINTGRAQGFNQNVPLLNGSLSKQFFKKKNAELKFSVRDIFNQNQSINRSTADNYIQDTRSMVLRRYFLLSFLYSWNRFGS